MDRLNDKNLVIFALLIIAIGVLFREPSANSINILNGIVSGMLGMAIGRATA